jgi:hypothetical protein
MQVELDLQLASEATELPSEAQLRQWCELALRQRSAPLLPRRRGWRPRRTRFRAT